MSTQSDVELVSLKLVSAGVKTYENV